MGILSVTKMNESLNALKEALVDIKESYTLNNYRVKLIEKIKQSSSMEELKCYERCIDDWIDY